MAASWGNCLTSFRKRTGDFEVESECAVGIEAGLMTIVGAFGVEFHDGGTARTYGSSPGFRSIFLMALFKLHPKSFGD